VVAQEESSSSGFEWFYVYLDSGSEQNHFSPSGPLGDFVDCIDLAAECEDSPRSGQTCLRIEYDPEDRSVGWAGMYWLEPEGKWESEKGGHDLRGAQRLRFWARGAVGGEVVAFRVAGIPGEHGDSEHDPVAVRATRLTLTSEWHEYDVDVSACDLSHVVGGFSFWVAHRDNPDGCVFYLDDIAYEVPQRPKQEAKAPEKE